MPCLSTAEVACIHSSARRSMQQSKFSHELRPVPLARGLHASRRFELLSQVESRTTQFDTGNADAIFEYGRSRVHSQQDLKEVFNKESLVMNFDMVPLHGACMHRIESNHSLKT